MNWVIHEKPPWKTVEWIQSPLSTTLSVPVIEYTDVWKHTTNEVVTKMKETIEYLDKTNRWELAKKMANPYELVYTQNDDNFPKSICMINPLSRSYFKMVEILHICSFFKGVSNKIISAHVAEGPGGFIQGLYDTAEKNTKTIMHSIAMTLTPVNSQVPGWKKSYKFISKYKQLQIHYGEDGTGNIYNTENQRSYISEITKLGGAHIFTADGGFDFSNDYSQQEMQIFHLLLSSATTGLRSLRKGGYFVLKIFDCASPHTKLLILFLSRCFQKWTLYKPAMTRPCNSEHYYVGVEMRTNMNNHNSTNTILTILIQMEEEVTRGKYPNMDITSIFTSEEIAYIEQHNSTSNQIQIRHIQNAIYFANNPDVWKRECLKNVLTKSYEWCESFGVYARPSAMSLHTTTRQ